MGGSEHPADFVGSQADDWTPDDVRRVLRLAHSMRAEGVPVPRQLFFETGRVGLALKGLLRLRGPLFCVCPGCTQRRKN